MLLAMTGAGWVDTRQLVVLPTAMFLMVYLACTAAGMRLLSGPARLGAAVCCAAVGVVLGFTGAAGLPAILLAGILALAGRRRTGRSHPPSRELVNWS